MPNGARARARDVLRAATAAAATAGAMLAIVRALPVAHSSGAAAERHFLPDVESAGYTSTLHSLAPSGMESFGYSTILLKNWSDASNATTLRIWNWLKPAVILNRDVAAGGVVAVPLRREPRLDVGRYTAEVTSSDALGVVVRTDWVTGAATALEAPEPSTDLILPLLVRNVYSHTTIIYVQNVDQSGTDNDVECRVFDNAVGDLHVSFTMRLEPAATVSYDSWFDQNTFGRMPANVAGGGSIGALRFKATNPLVVTAYGDEMSGDGTSAYAARPVTAASRQQYLPAVRANYLGHSLIAIVNPSMTTGLDATLSYRAHDTDASGSTYEQSVHVAARGAAYIDLGDLQRGERPSVALPRGTRVNGGFFGHAVVEASAPVLVSAQEEARDGAGVVRSIAAYNAWGVSDLDTELSIPRVYNDPAGRSTLLVMLNPGIEAADVALGYHGLDGAPLRSDALQLPPGTSHAMRVPASLPAECALDVVSSLPVAMLAYETTLLSPADWYRWGRDTLVHSALRRSEPAGPTPVVPTIRPTSDPTPTDPPPTATATLAPTRAPSPTPTDTPIRVSQPAYLPRADRTR